MIGLTLENSEDIGRNFINWCKDLPGKELNFYHGSCNKPVSLMERVCGPWMTT